MPGYRIVKVLGIVTGMSARTRGLGGRIPAWLEAHVGGRSEAYVAELKRAREEAVQDPIKEAAKLGANAVVGADFETSEVLEGFVVVTATGTAAVVEPGSPPASGAVEGAAGLGSEPFNKVAATFAR